METRQLKRARRIVRLRAFTPEQKIEAVRRLVALTENAMATDRSPEGAPPAKGPADPRPGDGIRSLQTSRLFKTLNFELYTKPNAVIMGIGVACMGGALLYLAYMRHKYEALGYYRAVTHDGKETFVKKKSKWE